MATFIIEISPCIFKLVFVQFQLSIFLHKKSSRRYSLLVLIKSPYTSIPNPFPESPNQPKAIYPNPIITNFQPFQTEILIKT